MIENIDQAKKDNEETFALLRSEEWRVYRDFLKRRIQKLQNKVNEAVESGDLVEAKVQLALMKDSTKLVEAFVQQAQQLKTNLATVLKEKENVRR